MARKKLTHVGFNPSERQLIEALIKWKKLGSRSPLKLAAEEVGLVYGSARNTLYRLRKRYRKAKAFIEEYEAYKKQLEEEI